MKKTFSGWLFNRIEKLGDRKFNHIGCQGESEKFVDFLACFVPEIGMRRKVKLTIESEKEAERVNSYRRAKDYHRR
jgi:hypothetical protein